MGRHCHIRQFFFPLRKLEEKGRHESLWKRQVRGEVFLGESRPEVRRDRRRSSGQDAGGLPPDQTYFSHWADLSPDSSQVKKHGGVIMGAVGEAVGKIDDIVGAVSNLSSCMPSSSEWTLPTS